MKKITSKLIAEAQRGNLEALDQILEGFSVYAYYHALAVLNNKQDADDCVQQALINLVEYIHTYDDKPKYFYGWTHKIIENVTKNYKRTQIRYQARVQNDEDSTFIAEDINSISNETKLMLSDLEKHIGEDLYKILLYKIGYEYQYDDIAKILNLSLSTVKRKYKEALNAAQQYLGEDKYEGKSKTKNKRRH